MMFRRQVMEEGMIETYVMSLQDDIFTCGRINEWMNVAEVRFGEAARRDIERVHPSQIKDLIGRD